MLHAMLHAMLHDKLRDPCYSMLYTTTKACYYSGILLLWHTTAMAYYCYGMLHVILNMILYASCYFLCSTMLYATCAAMLYTTCPLLRALYNLFSIDSRVCVLASVTSIYGGSERGRINYYKDNIELRHLLMNVLVSMVTLRVYNIALRNPLVNIYD